MHHFFVSLEITLFTPFAQTHPVKGVFKKKGVVRVVWVEMCVVSVTSIQPEWKGVQD